MFWRAAHFETRSRRIGLAWFALTLASLTGVLAAGDQPVQEWISQSPWVAEHRLLIHAITDYGMYPFYLLFLGMLLAGWSGRNRAALTLSLGYLMAQLIGAVLTVRVLKIMTGHARPKAAGANPGADWIGPTLDSAFHSFPSGHAADLFISAIFMALLLPRGWLRGACLGFAATVGLTRIALAEHYPLDVVAGAFIGGTTALAIIHWWVLPRLRRFESEATQPNGCRIARSSAFRRNRPV